MMQTLFPEEYEQKFWDKNMRSDGRSFDQIRSTSITYGISSAMNSSCMAKIGRTTIVAGCKLFVGVPTITHPNEGEIDITSHFSPVCSNRYPIGRPSAESFCLTAALTRIILGSGMIELEDLCIESGIRAWKLHIDILCIDDDGNALDAAVIATIGALKQLYLPETKFSEDDEKSCIVVDGQRTKLKLRDTPIALSFALTQHNKIALVDPTAVETKLAKGIVTIAYTTSGKLCAVDVVGGPISSVVLKELMPKAKARVIECAKLLKQP